jgi:hypothetical protein
VKLKYMGIKHSFKFHEHFKAVTLSCHTKLYSEQVLGIILVEEDQFSCAQL